MCAVIGALTWRLTTPERIREANRILNHINTASQVRGRDGRGYYINSDHKNEFYLYERDATRFDPTREVRTRTFFTQPCRIASVLGNLRAEPTSEYVKNKNPDDQQPYTDGDWTIVHNGTIANDRELRTNMLATSIDSAAIAEVLGSGPCGHTSGEMFNHFLGAVRKLKGSYAIIANHAASPDHLMVAVNYRPLWYAVTNVGVFFASSRSYFPDNLTPVMVTPYSAISFTYDGTLQRRSASLHTSERNNRALVVCSGGLDSVVAATMAKQVMGYDIELIHFLYGSRAEGPEIKAVNAVAMELGVPCTLFPLDIYDESDSPLLSDDSTVAGGEEGAEFAHEWVPARNLLLLSVATAYAEAKGFGTIILGNNLEEAGAYPDNEPEFIDRFNDLLPFAVADGKRIEIVMPVGTLMKHEIVELGRTLGAPLHLTWSCYRAGEKHCGTCGPCYMRRKAFEINGAEEVIKYEGGNE